MNSNASTSLSVRIREAEPKDAAEVARLSAELGDPMDPALAAKRIAHISEQPDNTIFVAMSGKATICGYIQVYAVSTLHSDLAVIAGLVVDEPVRGKGVGMRLVVEAEEWATRRGLHAMTVRSRIAREGAHEFYKRIGYEFVKTQHMFRKRF